MTRNVESMAGEARVDWPEFSLESGVEGFLHAGCLFAHPPARVALVTFGSAADRASPHLQMMRQRLDEAGFEVKFGDEGPPLAEIILVTSSVDDAIRSHLQVRRRQTGRVLMVAEGLTADVQLELLGLGVTELVAFERSGLDRALARLERWRSIDRVLARFAVHERIVGRSLACRYFVDELAEAAVFGTGSVLLLGETGTGKEAAARVVHDLDARHSSGSYVIVDCATLHSNLAGSELFGHERGAFTGASGPRVGAFASSDGGTLFLDEIGELPLDLQPQLLRVLQEGTYRPVGSNEWKRIGFRLVAATNRDLFADADAGRFRRDLLHRIAAHVVRIPPLRERREDIVPLARHFARTMRPKTWPEIDPALAGHLVERSYPGNVRELQKLIESALGRYPGVGPLGLTDLPPGELGHSDRDSDAPLCAWLRMQVTRGVSAREIETKLGDLLRSIALEEARGTVRIAARALGLSTRALQKWRARSDAANGAPIAEALHESDDE